MLTQRPPSHAGSSSAHSSLSGAAGEGEGLSSSPHPFPLPPGMAVTEPGLRGGFLLAAARFWFRGGGGWGGSWGRRGGLVPTHSSRWAR